MTNRLAAETSPYLLQHAENPVDWYPWGPEAFEAARASSKPILLSIGYAACHWCHVMAHESFENESIASMMNEQFINIKVDREERPDVDAVYMQAVQAIAGHGGWPMTVFLTPAGEPFYGGTYYPPEDRPGMPGFPRVLSSVFDAWRNKPDAIAQTAREINELYAAARMQAVSEGTLTAPALDLAYRGVMQKYDVRYGGFDGPPKFPQTMTLDFLLRYWRRTGTDYALRIVVDSFRLMARGGLYDQIGGGFHRYTVDAMWLIPHFEKMLYDNALLIRLGTHLWQATQDEEMKRVTEETVQWAAREMISPEGGFYSSLDADSEGEEGRFYVWSHDELEDLLGSDTQVVKDYFNVTPGGNFEGRNILHVRADMSLSSARAGISQELLSTIISDAKETLYAARAERVWPGRDEKVLASWNGLMLRGVATAARAFQREDFRRLALRNGEFLVREMIRDGRVLRSRTAGETKIAGFLEDYAAVGVGFLALYELTFDGTWVGRAKELAHSMIEWFWDDATGAFFDTARDGEALITRPRDPTDNATPSGTSLAIELMLGIAELCHDEDMRRRATFVLETLATPLMRHALSFGNMLCAADMALNGAVEVAIAGNPGDPVFAAFEHEAAIHYVPSLVLAGGPASETIALLKDREPGEGRVTAYVCRSYACEEPATTPEMLARQLENAGAITAPAQ